MEKMRSLLHILETAARRAQIPAGNHLQRVAKLILKRLAGEKIEELDTPEAQKNIVETLKELEWDPLIVPYLEYCRELKLKSSPAENLSVVAAHNQHSYRQSLLSIPKFNLKTLLYPEYREGAPRDIGRLTSAIASIILRQYSMEEVFAPDVIEAHMAGEIHIEGISSPMKMFALLLHPPTLSAFGEITRNEDFIISLMAELERVLPFVEDSINIYRPDRHLTPNADDIRSLLIALTHNFHRVAPVSLILDRASGEFISALTEVYRQVDSLNRRSFLPHLALPIYKESFGKEQMPHIADVCELALYMRKVTFWFTSSYLGNWPDPSKILWAFDSIFINLVQAACRAKKNIGKFWDELSRIFGVVVKAHLDKRRFFLSLALQTLWDDRWKELYPLGKAGCFLEIVGLPESVLYLTGKEMREEEGWDLAVQTLARLQELAQNVADQHGIQIQMVDYVRDDRAESRFVSLDREKFPELKDFFSEAVYTKGPHFRLANSLSPQEKIRMEGNLHRYFPCAVLLMPEMNPKEFLKLLRFAHQSTEAVAVRIC